MMVFSIVVGSEGWRAIPCPRRVFRAGAQRNYIYSLYQQQVVHPAHHLRRMYETRFALLLWLDFHGDCVTTLLCDSVAQIQPKDADTFKSKIYNNRDIADALRIAFIAGGGFFMLVALGCFYHYHRKSSGLSRSLWQCIGCDACLMVASCLQILLAWIHVQISRKHAEQTPAWVFSLVLFVG